MTDTASSLEGAVGSGSYDSEDVLFLLKEIDIAPTDIKEKERMIQSGQKHYSDMISAETEPSDVHEELFEQALTQNAPRMASEIIGLARGLDVEIPNGEIVLVSLVRAGLPLGVLLKHALWSLHRTSFHYGVSIIRDRGIDTAAMKWIIAKHGTRNIVFVDGWTGKGAISGEIKRSLARFDGFPKAPRLLVLADPCGKAWMAASAEDWIIPSGILGATVSGLISRSIWTDDGGLHGCVSYPHLQGVDRSQEFISRIKIAGSSLTSSDIPPVTPWTAEQQDALQVNALSVVNRMAERFHVDSLNRVKPGIAEATRAVMRRVPDHVLVRSKADPDVKLLMHLTDRVGITVVEAGETLGPYRALTIIKKVK